jgi:dTDP-4-amino-4,6-dideoxygalactose transaminase
MNHMAPIVRSAENQNQVVIEDACQAHGAEYFSRKGNRWSRAIYHLYVIRTAARDTMQTKLSNEKIGTGLHYPVPVHLQNAYKDYGFKKGDFPITERIATELLSLPMFPTIAFGQQQSLAQALSQSKALEATAKGKSRITASLCR